MRPTDFAQHVTDFLVEHLDALRERMSTPIRRLRPPTRIAARSGLRSRESESGVGLTLGGLFVLS